MPHYKFDQIAYNIRDKKMPEPGDEKTYIGLQHLDSGSLKVTRWGNKVELKGQKLVMKKGDLLFGRRNTYLRRAAIAPHDGIFSAHGMIFRPKTEVIDPEYFPFFISSNYFMDAAIRISVGSLSPTVNWKTLKELEFDIPSLEEQKKTAELLKAINDTKEAYQELLLKTDDLVKSEFIEMFSDCDNKQPIKDICVHFGDGDWIESKDQSEEGIRLIQTGNVGDGVFKDKEEKARYISEETFEKLNCTEVFPGDILISRLPDPIGRACIVPEVQKSITAVDCTIIRLNDNVLSEFFVGFAKTEMYSEQIATYTTGTTRKRISRANLGKILIPVPRLSMQEEFVSFARQSEKSKFELRQAIESTDNLIKSILYSNLEEKKE